MNICRGIASTAWMVDRLINWFSDFFAAGLAVQSGRWISRRHSGSYAVYLFWSVAGLAALIIWFVVI